MAQCLLALAAWPAVCTAVLRWRVGGGRGLGGGGDWKGLRVAAPSLSHVPPPSLKKRRAVLIEADRRATKTSLCVVHE